MRHARAEPFAATDQDRELTRRGRAQASAAGAHLAASGLVPDHVVVSPATRARQTLDAVLAASGGVAEPEVTPAVYTGGPEVVLATLQQVPAEAATVLFVGHNPAASFLCHLLDDGDGDPAALQGLLRGFPAGALAVFEVEAPWSGLGAETGRVVDFFVAD